MTTSPSSQPPLNEPIDGEWFEIVYDNGNIIHSLVVQCPKCGIGIRYGIVPQEIERCGLEGAEELAERIVRKQWNKETDCTHLRFGKEGKKV